jgi:hypothetical protein
MFDLRISLRILKSFMTVGPVGSKRYLMPSCGKELTRDPPAKKSRNENETG